MPGEPLWINYDPVSGTPEYDANEMRQAMSLALMYGGRAVGARQGVRPGGNQLQVSLAGSTITVQPGLCVVDPALTTTQGPYWVAIPVAENPVGGPLAAADATNPRKDIVVARVYDHDMDASGLRLARSEYRAGAAGPTPSLPAVQAGEILLATIDVPRSGNGAAAVTNVFPFTVASGGILPVRAAGDIAAAVEGRYRDRLDTNVLERDSGAAWETVADPAAFAAWKTYTPNITGLTGYVAGNDVRTGRYRVMGKTMDWMGRWSIGSTTTVGTAGSIGMDLPLVVKGGQLLVCHIQDSSTSNRYPGVGYLIGDGSTGTGMRLSFAQGQGSLTHANPVPLAAGDILTIQATLELV